MNKVIVKSSKIKGEGVFATKKIKKGEIVIKWHPKSKITKKEMFSLSKNEQNHTSYIGNGKYIVMGVPERYVNHSCNPNTYVKNMRDITLKSIKKGEEITSDYSINGVDNWKMKCKCGSKNCRKTVYGDFMKLPKKLRKKYNPLLESWFKREVLRK